MKEKILLFSTLFFLISCSGTKKITKNNGHTLLDDNTFLLTKVSSDDSYGLSSKNPIEVGSEGGGPKNERRFLNALCGPNQEAISYYRAGSCCPIKSENALFGETVLLDEYRVSYSGSTDTVSIFINMYDMGEMMAPKGFLIKND